MIYFDKPLISTYQKSSKAASGGLNNAVNLQKLLETMTKEITNSHSEAASAHEKSLQVISQRTEAEIDMIIAMVVAAATSVESLGDQIVSYSYI